MDNCTPRRRRAGRPVGGPTRRSNRAPLCLIPLHAMSLFHQQTNGHSLDRRRSAGPVGLGPQSSRLGRAGRDDLLRRPGGPFCHGTHGRHLRHLVPIFPRPGRLGRGRRIASAGTAPVVGLASVWLYSRRQNHAQSIRRGSAKTSRCSCCLWPRWAPGPISPLRRRRTGILTRTSCRPSKKSTSPCRTGEGRDEPAGPQPHCCPAPKPHLPIPPPVPAGRGSQKPRVLDTVCGHGRSTSMSLP